MGWEISELKLDANGGLASAFQFELLFTGFGNVPQCFLRGDGIVVRAEQVRFNREAELRALLEGLGFSAQDTLHCLADRVLSCARQSTVGAA